MDHRPEYHELSFLKVGRSELVIPPRVVDRPASCLKVHMPCAVWAPQTPSIGPVGIANLVRIRCASTIWEEVAASAGDGTAAPRITKRETNTTINRRSTSMRTPPPPQSSRTSADHLGLHGTKVPRTRAAEAAHEPDGSSTRIVGHALLRIACHCQLPLVTRGARRSV